jgi:copper chaperone CopZ
MLGKSALRCPNLAENVSATSDERFSSTHSLTREEFRRAPNERYTRFARRSYRGRRIGRTTFQVAMFRLVTFIISLGICSLAAADTIKATIKGTACDLCASTIEKTFRAQPEVKTVDVDLENKLVTIQTKPGLTIDDSKIRKLLGNVGYSVVAVGREKQ